MSCRKKQSTDDSDVEDALCLSSSKCANEGAVGAKMNLAKKLQRCLKDAKRHKRELREERQEDAGTQPSEHDRRGIPDKTSGLSE